MLGIYPHQGICVFRVGWVRLGTDLRLDLGWLSWVLNNVHCCGLCAAILDVGGGIRHIVAVVCGGECLTTTTVGGGTDCMNVVVVVVVVGNDGVDVAVV